MNIKYIEVWKIARNAFMKYLTLLLIKTGGIRPFFTESYTYEHIIKISIQATPMRMYPEVNCDSLLVSDLNTRLHVY
jgi:hypothetical protein